MSTKTKFKVTLAAVAAMSSVAVAQSGSNYTIPLTGLGENKPLDMIFVEGGTYKRGCSDGDNQCENTEKPQHNVTLSNYYVGKYEITNAQWQAVMDDGTTANDKPKTSINWYNAVEFTCKLSQQTGKKYRLLTDAEFEYAARGGKNSNGTFYAGSSNPDLVAWHNGQTLPQVCTQYCFTMGNRETCNEYCYDGYGAADVGLLAANELGTYDMSGNVYEWTFDNWGNYSSNAADLTDPTTTHTHTQKTRRGGSHDQPASESRVSGRKIRSIEGADGSIGFRLALSATDTRPPNMADPCEIQAPEAVQCRTGFKDDRLITADDEVWTGGYNNLLVVNENSAITGMTYNGSMYQPTQGEWYTLNCFSLNIVQSSGAVKKYIYYMIDNDNMSMMEEGGMPGRWERKKKSEVSGAANVNAPAVANPTPKEQLAPAGYNVDMSNPPTAGRDPRLIEGPDSAWLQDNVAMNAGGTHRYRKDFDTQDSMRFVVYDAAAGSSVILAGGSWFTVDNNFLRVDHGGKNHDYLYTVTADGKTLYHISYIDYEPGDFRMFKKVANNEVPQWSEPTFSRNDGNSTYTPPSDDPVTPIIAMPKTASGNFVAQIRNGLNLQALKGATVEVYGVKGNLINRQSYAGGVHSVSFNNLAKGMYVVKVKFGGSEVKVLRVPVL